METSSFFLFSAFAEIPHRVTTARGPPDAAPLSGPKRVSSLSFFLLVISLRALSPCLSSVSLERPSDDERQERFGGRPRRSRSSLPVLTAPVAGDPGSAVVAQITKYVAELVPARVHGFRSRRPRGGEADVSASSDVIRDPLIA